MQFVIKKALYVDTDLLCLNDISELFHVNLDNFIALVTEDAISSILEKHCRNIGMQENSYFNSGVLLINIPEYIKYDIGKKAVKLAQDKNYIYMDQDVLNILLENKVKIDITYKYNCTMSVSDSQIPDIIDIVHFTGSQKPWKAYTTLWGSNKDPIPFKKSKSKWKYQYYALWRQYAAESPWADVPYDTPKNVHEWRWLSDMYRKNGEFIKAVKAYYRYVTAKLST